MFLVIVAATFLGCASPRVVRRMTRGVPQEGAPPKNITVGGEAREPGTYSWTNGMKASDAIRLAGGATQWGPRWLSIYHWDGSSEEYRLDHGFQPIRDVELKAGDALFFDRQ
jgi:protein involved in polysaccharide export with SLBB domain